MKIRKAAKSQDLAAATITFGVEIETIIPVTSGVIVGGYHNGTKVSAARALTGEIVIAPTVNGGAWKAERDRSIQVIPGYVACEFVSPILSGVDGVANLVAMVAFIKSIGGKVNSSCGCHITVGTESIIGAGDTKSKANFYKKLATIANHNSWAIYAQTAPGRHVNHYSAAFSPRVAELMDTVVTSTNILEIMNAASNCGRGMVNFKKAFNPIALVEFRAFAGTLNTSRILHHLATVLGLCRRAATVGVLGSFKRSAKHSNIPNAVEAVERMYRTLGWASGTGRDVALGLFGQLHERFDNLAKCANKNATGFDLAYPGANL